MLISPDSGRPSIPPERLLPALLLQAFYNVAAPCKPLAWCSGKKVP
jgi:transposase